MHAKQTAIRARDCAMKTNGRMATEERTAERPRLRRRKKYTDARRTRPAAPRAAPPSRQVCPLLEVPSNVTFEHWRAARGLGDRAHALAGLGRTDAVLSAQTLTDLRNGPNYAPSLGSIRASLPGFFSVRFVPPPRRRGSGKKKQEKSSCCPSSQLQPLSTSARQEAFAMPLPPPPASRLLPSSCSRSRRRCLGMSSRASNLGWTPSARLWVVRRRR